MRPLIASENGIVEIAGAGWRRQPTLLHANAHSLKPNYGIELTDQAACCYPTLPVPSVIFLPFLEEHTTNCLAGPTLAPFR